MDENALILLKCPNCEKVHADTLADLTAHWEEPFQCDKCGVHMKLDREELLGVIESSEPGETPIINMRGVS